MRSRNFITICIFTLSNCFATYAFGQTISTGTVPSSLCPGDTVYVPFTATGKFQLKNTFIAQLSNSQGNFNSGFVTLGSTSDTTISPTYVTGIVPSGLVRSTHYRIRVISGLPYVAGSDNGSDILVGAVITALYGINDITPGNVRAALIDMPVPFYNASYTESDSSSRSSPSSPGTYLWNFGDGASPVTSTDSEPGTVTYSTAGPKTVTLTATSSDGCVNSYHIPTGEFNVYDCFPAIPSTAIIDSSTFVPKLLSDTIWVVSGGTLNINTSNDNRNIVFAEPGSNINIALTDDNQSVIYLKAGATCNVTGENRLSVIIYTDGAGISYGPGSDSSSIALLKCDSLNFNYSNAPPYHLTLGVHEGLTAPMNITLYPNPANDMLHVFTGTTMPSSVRLFNALGEEAWSAAGHVTNNVQIPTYALQNGVYYLQVTAPGKISTEKVTVIH